MDFAQIQNAGWDRVTLGHGKATDFPEGHVLFVKRDMYSDSGFPNTIMPKTKEAFLAFIAETQLRDTFTPLQDFNLRVEDYHGSLIVVAYYTDASQGQWVLGFLRYGVPEGMEIPFSQHFIAADLVLSEGWTSQVVTEADPEERGDQAIHYWSKNDIS